MRWLDDFKKMIDNNPEVSDGELFRAFPELQFKEERMNAALLYWNRGIVVPEFKNKTVWHRIINFFRWPKKQQ